MIYFLKVLEEFMEKLQFKNNVKFCKVLDNIFDKTVGHSAELQFFIFFVRRCHGDLIATTWCGQRQRIGSLCVFEIPRFRQHWFENNFFRFFQLLVCSGFESFVLSPAPASSTLDYLILSVTEFFDRSRMKPQW